MSSGTRFPPVDRITTTYRPRASQLSRLAGAARRCWSGGARKMRADVAKSGHNTTRPCAMAAVLSARLGTAVARASAPTGRGARHAAPIAPARASALSSASFRASPAQLSSMRRDAHAAHALRCVAAWRACSRDAAGAMRRVHGSRTSALAICSGAQPAARLAPRAACFARS